MNADLEHCREAIKTGSLSFHTASRLLPAHVRDPALVLYAFCRLADDEVIQSALPGEMYRLFDEYKRDEWIRFLATTSDWDVDNYLYCLP